MLKIRKLLTEVPTEEVRAALQSCFDAHHAFEVSQGKDPDWTQWYAEYLKGERRRVVYPATG